MRKARTRALTAAALGVGLAFALGSCHPDSSGEERRQNNEERQSAAEFGEELPRIAFEVGYQLSVIEHAEEDPLDAVHRLRLLADRLGELQGHGVDRDQLRRRSDLIEEAYFGYLLREFVEEESARTEAPETNVTRSVAELANCLAWVAGKRVPRPWSEAECREVVAEARGSENERRQRVRDEAAALVDEICRSLYSWTSREHVELSLYRDTYSEIEPGQLRRRFEDGGGLGGPSREADAAMLGVVEAGVSELLRGIDGYPYLNDWSRIESGWMDCVDAAGEMTTPRLRTGLPKRYRDLLDDREWPRASITLAELRELRLQELGR